MKQYRYLIFSALLIFGTLSVLAWSRTFDGNIQLTPPEPLPVFQPKSPKKDPLMPSGEQLNICAGNNVFSANRRTGVKVTQEQSEVWDIRPQRVEYPGKLVGFSTIGNSCRAIIQSDKDPDLLKLAEAAAKTDSAHSSPSGGFGHLKINRFYAEGDTLPSGGKLLRLYPDSAYAVVAYNGIEHNLFLKYDWKELDKVLDVTRKTAAKSAEDEAARNNWRPPTPSPAHIRRMEQQIQRWKQENTRQTR